MKKIEMLEKEGDDKEEQEMKKKDKVFLEKTLIEADSIFAKYNKGYMVFSIKNPLHRKSIDDKMLTKIANKISNKYGCKLISLASDEKDRDYSKQTYLYTFEK